MTLRQHVLQGLSWSFISRLGSQLFQLVFSIALARLLSPVEFGLIGMLLAFTGFAQALADGGLCSALIYHRDISEVHKSTAFWTQVAAGAALSLLFYLGAPWIAEFYNAPLLYDLSRFLACIFVIQAAGLVHNALLMREFRFKAIAGVTISATLLSGAVAITLAMRGFGVWALAWQVLVSTGATTLLLWLQSDWRPHFLFDGKIAKELWRYGIYLLGHSSLNYWMRNGASLLIGKAVGAHALGIFTRAYTLMLLPLNNISAVLGQVMFPALARVQDDIPRFRQHYLTATRLIALVSFPLMVGVAVLSQPLILLLLGPRWAEVIPILQILSFVGMFQSIIFPVGWVFTALGKTRDQFLLSMMLLVLFVIAMAIGIRFGLSGVIYAYCIWTLMSGWLNLRLIQTYIMLSPMTILMSIAQITLIAGTMGVLVRFVDIGVAQQWPYAVRLVTGFLTGLISYVGLCLLMRNDTFEELARLTFERLQLKLPLYRAK
jgi:O-antigen/teichoic acid export membrane protein